MKILLSYLSKYRWVVVLALFLAAINIGFSLLDPFITGKIVDKYIVPSTFNKEKVIHIIDKLNERPDSKSLNHDQLSSVIDQITKALYNVSFHQFLMGVLTLIGLAIGAAMVSRIAKNFQDYFTNIIVLKVGAQMYADGLKHSLELPFQVFEDQRSGETLGILQKVRLDCEKFITSFISVLFVSLVGMIFVMVMSVKVSYQVSLVYLGAIPIIAFVSTALSKRIKKVQRNIVAETTSLAGSTTESLRNIELVKSLGLSKQEIERLNKTTFKILGLELKKVKYVRSMSFVQGTTVNLVRSIMVVILMMLIFKGTLTPGSYFMFLFYSFFLFNPLQELGNTIQAWREAEVSLGNFQRILSTPVEVKPDNPVLLEKVRDLTFDEVSFKHLTANRNALNHISFDVKTGETIAFVGPSGSGKTTLVKLLVGLYQPMEGTVSYNSISGSDIDLDQLREKIGFVTQDTQLFSGSIRENLQFVRPDATDEECMQALHRAACQGLLARASNGLDTVIGEGGVKVSGGEKQRLSIARALLRRPDILVFDEATSSLDSLTEEEITETIRDVSVLKDHITILIAHRLSTIMHADTIYVLEKGRIVECGKHTELLLQKGLYYAMWRQQIGEKITADVN